MNPMAEQDLVGVDRYIIGQHLGGGTYADIFQAIDLVTSRLVAVKILRPEEVTAKHMVIESAGNDINNLWEVHVLRKLKHANIIKLLDVYVHHDTHHLVFELMVTDLCGITEDQPLNSVSPADCKSYMQMLLQGLAHLHQNSILHRDVKPDNLLIGPDGVLKLADFGFSCSYNPNVEFNTSKVFVTAFRAPELLKGVKRYGPEVDIWAAGCVFAELILGREFFTGEHQSEQLQQIYERFRVPSATHPLGCEYCTIEHPLGCEYCTIETLRKLFPGTSEDCLELLQQMFEFDPKRRITAQQALEHRYFTSSPMPTPAYLLPRKPSPEIDLELYRKAIRRGLNQEIQ